MKKTKCPLCLKEHGRRSCPLKDDALICSRCCAELRSQECGDCPHYAEAAKHAVQKLKKSGFQHFTARIDPEVDEAVDQALELAAAGKLAKAKELMTGLMESNRDLYIVHYGMGTIQALEGDYRGSIASFDRAVTIYPYFTEAWYNKGTSHKAIRDLTGMIRSYQKVVELGDPSDRHFVTARDLLADLSVMIRRDSGMSLDRYVQVMDRFAQAVADLEDRKYENAASGFRTVLSHDPRHTQSHGNLGLCFAFLGKKEEALASLDRALEIDPRYQPAIDNRRVVAALSPGERMPDDHFEVVEYFRKRDAGTGS